MNQSEGARKSHQPRPIWADAGPGVWGRQGERSTQWELEAGLGRSDGHGGKCRLGAGERCRCGDQRPLRFECEGMAEGELAQEKEGDPKRSPSHLWENVPEARAKAVSIEAKHSFPWCLLGTHQVCACVCAFVHVCVCGGVRGCDFPRCLGWPCQLMPTVRPSPFCQLCYIHDDFILQTFFEQRYIL